MSIELPEARILSKQMNKELRGNKYFKLERAATTAKATKTKAKHVTKTILTLRCISAPSFHKNPHAN